MERSIFQTTLSNLKPGTRFQAVDLRPEQTGILLKVNECRARVRFDRPAEDVEFVNGDGDVRHFTKRRGREMDVSPQMRVIPISAPQPEETEMSTKTTKKTASKKSSATNKPAKAAKKAAGERAPRKDGKLSQLDAAAQVLAKASAPMNCKEIVDAMAAAGLWKSPGGKTPDATLSSAIRREIEGKGKEARFKKVTPGHYELAK